MHLLPAILLLAALLTGCISHPQAGIHKGRLSREDIAGICQRYSISPPSEFRDTEYHSILSPEELPSFFYGIPQYLPENFDCDEIALDALAQLNRFYHGEDHALAVGILYLSRDPFDRHTVLLAFSSTGAPYLLDPISGYRGYLRDLLPDPKPAHLRLIFF